MLLLLRALGELWPEPGSGLPAPFTFQPVLASLLPLGLQKLTAEEGENQICQPRVVDSGTELKAYPSPGYCVLSWGAGL